eukprot:SAG11_NODE_12_length_27025_cov_37.402681_15_plen_62_part_00
MSAAQIAAVSAQANCAGVRFRQLQQQPWRNGWYSTHLHKFLHRLVGGFAKRVSRPVLRDDV